MEVDDPHGCTIADAGMLPPRVGEIGVLPPPPHVPTALCMGPTSSNSTTNITECIYKPMVVVQRGRPKGTNGTSRTCSMCADECILKQTCPGKARKAYCQCSCGSADGKRRKRN